MAKKNESASDGGSIALQSLTRQGVNALQGLMWGRGGGQFGKGGSLGGF